MSLFSSNIKPGISCYRIPALITAPNGNLIAAIDERKHDCGDLRTNTDINIVIRRSSDNGQTWSAIETVVDYPLGQSASDPSMLVDKKTGTLFLFYNYMDLNAEKDVYYFYFIQSTDNGKTWSKPVNITKQIVPENWRHDFKFITSGSGIQTADGKLIHTLVNLQKGLYVICSNDDGKTWHRIETAIKPADESKIIELADGTWMINSRVNNFGYRYVHTSADAGKSWLSKPDSALIDPGCNASIIRYSTAKNGAGKNILLFVNANDMKERKNLTLRLSYDEGQTWTNGKSIYEGNAAYVSMTILLNGDIGLFFEKDNYTDNVFVRIPFKWLSN
ncbi:MAG: exo-alpha-sialidase [Bacteroidia bacterium]|nr:exo-alpha-sialidase [Bacteroidia bacterium]